MNSDKKDLDIEPCCRTCQFFKTIERDKLYQCLKYAFRRVADGQCAERIPWANGK